MNQTVLFVETHDLSLYSNHVSNHNARLIGFVGKHVAGLSAADNNSAARQ